MNKDLVCADCGESLVDTGVVLFCPKCEPAIVDAPSAGLTKCPKCNNHSVNEKGYCYNGCDL